MKNLSVKAFQCFATVLLFGCLTCHCEPVYAQEAKSSSPPVQRVIADFITYTNRRYEFRFVLPATWRGYSIVPGNWSGMAMDGTTSPAERGPKVSIRNPLWTKANPRQDIPIMIFTLKQWDLVSQEKIAVSAAPIGPTELGRNARYVFALPPRYNYAFPEGYEEVEKIVANHPLHAY